MIAEGCTKEMKFQPGLRMNIARKGWTERKESEHSRILVESVIQLAHLF